MTLRWIVARGYRPTGSDPFTPPPSAETTPGGFVFLPIARDGSSFSPECRQGGGYWIGAKHEERKVADYFGALAQLVQAPTPHWRRKNAAGHAGIVTGVRWDRVPRAQIDAALADQD